MSKTKNFLMAVSEDIGAEGELTPAVMKRAQQILNNAAARDAMLRKIGVTSESKNISSKQQSESGPTSDQLPGGSGNTPAKS